MKRRLFNFLTGLSLLMCVAVLACWVFGMVGKRHAAVVRLGGRPERSFFARVSRQHLILSDQLMVPVGMPAGYVLDSTHFRQSTVTGPTFPPAGVGTELDPEYFALNPDGAGFRKFRLWHGGVKVHDERGAIAWQVRAAYGAVEIPWWSLLILCSALPASRWLVRHRRRSRARHRLCESCGYDLRATPGRCPECGTVAEAPA